MRQTISISLILIRFGYDHRIHRSIQYLRNILKQISYSINSKVKFKVLIRSVNYPAFRATVFCRESCLRSLKQLTSFSRSITNSSFYIGTCLTLNERNETTFIVLLCSSILTKYSSLPPVSAASVYTYLYTLLFHSSPTSCLLYTSRCV